MKYSNSRSTKQMRLIFHIIQKNREHPTANEIFLAARQTLPQISLGTVYRNIDKLVESHKIFKFDSGENKFRYDIMEEEHYHARCLLCGKIRDLTGVDLSAVRKQCRKESHFKKLEIKLEITGICPECCK